MQYLIRFWIEKAVVVETEVIFQCIWRKIVFKFAVVNIMFCFIWSDKLCGTYEKNDSLLKNCRRLVPALSISRFCPVWKNLTGTKLLLALAIGGNLSSQEEAAGEDADPDEVDGSHPDEEEQVLDATSEHFPPRPHFLRTLASHNLKLTLGYNGQNIAGFGYHATDLHFLEKNISILSENFSEKETLIQLL